MRAIRLWPSPLLLVGLAFGLASLALASGAARAADGEDADADDADALIVVVADPFLELRSGPGSGYPVFHVVDRGRRVALLSRRSDWFLVREITPRGDGASGWVLRTQLERTRDAAGLEISFRDLLLDDYLASHLLLALQGGRFGDDPQMSLAVGWRFNDAFTVEGRYARATGSFSRSELLQLALVAHPFPDWRWQPTWQLGIGQLDNRPQATLVGGVRVSSPAMSVGFGVERYLARRFVFRAGYAEHLVLVDDERSERYRELSAGFAVFF